MVAWNFHRMIPMRRKSAAAKPVPTKSDEFLRTPERRTPVAILVRVSTTKQETARQLSELRDYAEGKGYSIVAECEEKASGASDVAKRQGIHDVLDLARQGRIQKVLVHEVSRVARRNSVAHRFVEELEELGVSLYWHAQGIETMLPNGKRNPAASVMFALLAELARNERETLSERIRSGLQEAAKRGRYPGRPVGTAMSPEELVRKHSKVVRQLRAGQSIRNTAKICGVSKGTVERVRKAMFGNEVRASG